MTGTTELFSSRLSVQALPTAVNSFASSKKKNVKKKERERVREKKPLLSTKNPPLPLARSSHRTFLGICCCEPSQNSEQRRSASRNYDLLTLCKTRAQPLLLLRTHARPCTCTLLGNMRVTRTLSMQQRGLIGAGGWTGGIPSCVLSTNQCRQRDKHGCNRILAAHCVPSPPKGGEKNN